jgi:hypothetical protein
MGAEVTPHIVDDRPEGPPLWAVHVAARLPAMRAFVVVGASCVVTGGLTAAVARPTGFAEGSWLAAYLVLVGGVAQVAMGSGQALLARRPPSARLVAAELVVWNVGMVCVVAGTLLPAVALTLLGGIATAAALAAFLKGVHCTCTAAPAVVVRGYRSLAIFVLASTPVGLLLAWLRYG